jgi:hypothetical protein
VAAEIFLITYLLLTMWLLEHLSPLILLNHVAAVTFFTTYFQDHLVVKTLVQIN